jgi:hypothetical protein
MLIECTKKLADVLKIKLSDTPISIDPLYEWHANLFLFDRRKGVIMMNNQTRYSVVLYGLKAEHFKKFESIALSAIEQTFLAEGITKEAVAQYINNCGDVTFTKTHDRSILGQLNDVQVILPFYIEKYLPSSDIYLIELSQAFGETPMTSLEHCFPIKALRAAIGA